MSAAIVAALVAVWILGTIFLAVAGWSHSYGREIALTAIDLVKAERYHDARQRILVSLRFNDRLKHLPEVVAFYEAIVAKADIPEDQSTKYRTAIRQMNESRFERLNHNEYWQIYLIVFFTVFAIGRMFSR